VPEYVVPLDVMVRWDPHGADAVLLAGEGGRAALALRAHPDDADRRCVVLAWEGVRSAAMTEPGDIALPGHPLYDRGLRDVLGVGVVQQSALIDELRHRHAGDPQPEPARHDRLVHHIVLLAERTVEVAAELLVVHRVAGPPAAAVFAAGG
jgi:hypothetical protein